MTDLTKTIEAIKALPDDKYDNCVSTFRCHLGESGDMLMIDDLKALALEYERLRDELEESLEPYMGWCDVAGCPSESSNNGCHWGNDNGYWKLCSKHSRMAREGAERFLMKHESVEREASRDENGYLCSKKDTATPKS